MTPESRVHSRVWMRVSALRLRWPVSGRVWRYLWVVWIWEWPIRSITLKASAGAARTGVVAAEFLEQLSKRRKGFRRYGRLARRPIARVLGAVVGNTDATPLGCRPRRCLSVDDGARKPVGFV